MDVDRDFYALFNDFKGYVDFFYLQDCVTKDYKHVHFWIGNGVFDSHPLPHNAEEYITWIEKELSFVKKRNKRIKEMVV